MSQPEVQHIPGTHNSECLCSDCNGVRKAHKAAEQRRQREDTRSFATEKAGAIEKQTRFARANRAYFISLLPRNPVFVPPNQH